MSIHPTNLAALLYYYQILPPLYRWKLEENNVQNPQLSLTTFLNFKEKICRTSFSFGIHNSHKDLSSLKNQSQDHLSSRASYPHAYNGKFDYADEEINSNYVKPIYDTFLFCDDANEWSKQIYEDQHNVNDTYKESSFEDIHESNQDLKLYKIFSNHLFQSKKIKELDTSGHTPPRWIFSFNNYDYFKDILMFLNSYYKSSLHHDDHVPDRKVPRDDTNLFDKCIDHLFNVQTLYHRSSIIDTFSTKCKASVGWHVLEAGDHLFWVLISHFSSPYTFFGWHVGRPSMCTFFKVIRFACKVGDTFFYDKFHPTSVHANGFFFLCT
jgi:hypothetical protein